jgi:SagB-type dehydrogenase family enzyme
VEELVTWHYRDADRGRAQPGAAYRRVVPVPAEPAPVPPDGLIELPLGARVWVDETGSLHICTALREPTFNRAAHGMTAGRVRREATVTGDLRLAWSLLRAMDGQRPVADVVATIPESDQPAATWLVAALSEAGVIDGTGRAAAAFAHTSTKYGVFPAVLIDPVEISRWGTNGNYRSYPDAPRVALHGDVPEALAPLHRLTRARRTDRWFDGRAVEGQDFAALLTTACGVTGTLVWGEGQASLRAYPSAGGLYAVEVYPVLFNVSGYDPGIYHFRPLEQGLEFLAPIDPSVGPSLIAGVALPDQAAITNFTGAAGVIFLTAVFSRAESKYGQGAYRVLAAESGHISQSLILAATALGLQAFPATGFFDDALNRVLGLDSAEEQFLLAVLLGRSS